MVRREYWALIVALMMILTWAVSSRADTWRYPDERTEEQFKFGDTRIVKVYDGTGSKGDNPYYAVDIYLKNDLKARYRGVSFEHWAASKDYGLFVGVSNFGPHRGAIIVFDSEGSLRGYVSHLHSRLQYCKKSVSLVREWYDRSNPGIRFEKSKDIQFRNYPLEPEITIKSCEGKRISISNLLKGGTNLGVIPTR